MKSKMDRRTFLKQTGALGIGLMSVGFPNVLRGAQPSAIKIGGLWPITGILAAGGSSCMNGAKVAISEINEAGGIKALGGAKLELIVADVQSKPEVGMAETERLIREGVSMLIGSWGTDITLAATQVSAKYGIPHLIDAAVSPEITERGFKHIFKLMGVPDSSARAALRDIPKLSEMTGVKPKTAVIFVVDSLYGRNMAKYYEKHLSKILDIGSTFKYPPGTKDLTVELSKIKAMKPDLLLVTNYVPDGILMTRQMKTLDFNCMAIWGMYDAARCVEEFMKGLGKLADYQWNTIENSDYKQKRYWEVSEKYKKLMGHNLPMDAAFSYTLMYVFADAVQRAKSTNKDKLIEALRKTYFKDHFLAGGAVTFGEDGQCQNDYNTSQEILVGKIENILPVKYQSAKPVFPVPKWSERPA
jgi:branched-chain amino acid transport system substrate-binding protein